jgi:glycosyltransferase involved in cell wall biosynthesis
MVTDYFNKKIVIVSEYDDHGGAAVAAKRLYLALKDGGYNVDYVHRASFTGLLRYLSESIVVFNKILERIIRLIFPKINHADFSYAFVCNPVLWYKLRTYDIVDFHWVRHWTNPLILNYLRGHRFVTNHDMRYFSCYHYLPIYNSSALKYIDTFGSLDNVKSIFRYNFSEEIVFRPPSKWLENASRFYCPKHSVKRAPYCVKSNKSSPKIIKEGNRKHVLCGAMSIVEFRKGGWLMEKVILKRQDLVFHVFGHSTLQGSNVVNHGFLKGKELEDLYAFCDVLLFTSIQENFSNILIEACIAELPIVCFDVGGNSDIVKHQVNGYVAEELSVENIIAGLDYCMSSANLEALAYGCELNSQRFNQLYFYF